MFLFLTSSGCEFGPISLGSNAPGSLVDVSMSSTVGVLLDEVPEAHRVRLVHELLAKDRSFWEDRARMQVTATEYRLVYRNFYYARKGQLPLPPPEVWAFWIGDPHEVHIDGHDLVAVDYRFHSVLVTGPDEPARADQNLVTLGKIWNEPFLLPADPDLTLDRIGYACVDEDGFPDHSVDSENVLDFFDQDCGGEDEFCHHTVVPGVDCADALHGKIGAVDTQMSFERVPWSDAEADEYRVGEQVPGVTAPAVVAAGLDDHRVVYKYFPADSCAIAEQCVGGSGWRRLLEFTAGMENKGALDLFIGSVAEPDSPIITHGLVELSSCHNHYHFNHYGTFTYGDALGGKRAFCIESTQRYFNNEDTPLVHPYGCDYQGTAAGWGDDYIAGIDCQWIDLTDTPTAPDAPSDLRFAFNPDSFLCEGKPILDRQGDPTFVPTDFIGQDGNPEQAMACEASPDAQADNVATLPLGLSETGTYVNEPCTRGQLGPNRNCGFEERSNADPCPPGADVTLSCALAHGGDPQVVRVCESSRGLGVGTACAAPDALGSAVVDEDGALVPFTCPAQRDAVERGGRYQVLTAPLVDGWDPAPVSCTLE